MDDTNNSGQGSPRGEGSGQTLPNPKNPQIGTDKSNRKPIPPARPNDGQPSPKGEN